MVGIPITKSEFRSKFINDLKKGGNINSNDMSIIIDKVVKNLTEYIDINDYDYIVSPKSSSDLTKTFIEKLNTLSNKPTFVNDMFIKNDVDDIWLDIETAQKELSGKYFKKLIKDFDKAKGMEGQPIKLQPLTNFQRKYVKNMLKINSDYDNVVLSMLDKKILVIDDILTSGKTLDEIKTLLSNLNTKEITLFSMFI
jgi:phosphoribosylpyrophosphate synthetase